MRRPNGDQRVGAGVEVGELRGRRLAVALERVDAQIERRAARQRRALRRAFLAEHAREIRIEPFRIVAGDPGRRASEVGRVEACAFRLVERRRRMARAVGEPRNRRDIEPALEPQHAEHRCAWPVIAHDVRARRAPAQRVVDEAGDRRPVAGAGEAMRKAPVLERIGRRPTPRFDVGQHLDRGGKTRAGRHPSPSMMRTMKMTHMMTSTRAPTP